MLGQSAHTNRFTHTRILHGNIHEHSANIIIENTKKYVVQNLLP
jgi:hypothetical protein